MILYKAIKYTILDYCIEKLFNSLERNLNLGESTEITNIEDVHEGMYLNRIEYGDYCYLRCKVIEIEKREDRKVVIAIDWETQFIISMGKYNNKPTRGIFMFTDLNVPGWGTETYLYK